ncbi:serine/threonine-protein kinase [Spinactinospora alkalitolerans]|uniref:non-specific serine/threonine protein kinase n=1 Tax=Spinactinospora alkalitolerans TaxID=687207 RepID=A0A852U3K8_9ACTN|nr:protein kinase [Spinactinospora alkalitolerans]NYE50808.1 serine/threonine-protein kinase [Spinactinospora alkalitolerans]
MSGYDADGPGPGGSGDRSGTLLSGRYELQERIGAGGMGEVWRATDVLLNRPVAVKMLHTAQMAEPTSRERFRTEARITAALAHPGIAQVYDYGEQDDHAFLVMELVPGEPLSSILKRNDGLEPGVTLDILNQAAQALGAAHAHDIVHRDIKPGNLLVTGDGAVKLTDFGIARGNESVTLTQTGMVMGTAQYISPEQASGRPASHASDIYSLGVVAYECLAGRPPFTSDTPLALALAHTREPPPPLPPSVPAQVRALVERMLEKEPEDRPGSAGEVARLAHGLLTGAGAAVDGATTAMDLADPDQTTVADVTGQQTGRRATRPSGRETPAAWPAAAAAGSSDRLAGESAPGRGVNRPLLLAAVGALAVLVLGIVLVGRLWDAPESNGRPAGNTEPDVSHSPTPSQQETVEDTDPQPPVEQGNTDPRPPTGEEQTQAPSGTPSEPATDPSASTPPVDSGEESEEPGGGEDTPGDGEGETGDDGPPDQEDRPEGGDEGDQSRGPQSTVH